MTTTALRWHSFSLHKEGNQPDEYEDAFAGNPKSGRFAVADGATESSFARPWAQLLVEGFVALREGRTTMMSWFGPLRQRWAESVDHLELDWFAEEKRAQGAFATFLGLSLKKPQGEKEGRWKALAVGDCCICQVRNDRLLTAFPVSKSNEFGNRPVLLGSRAGRTQADPLAVVKQRLGKWQPGDCFFLMTDAVAEWFLRCHENRQMPQQALLRMWAEPDAVAELTAYVEHLRQQKEMRNDDVTVVAIEL